MKTAIICIAKLENNYILEFCEHYKKLGFTNIIIFDNNDLSGERISDVLQSEIESGFVIIEELFGVQHAQRDAYQIGYTKYNTKYDWIAYFDIDELLILNPKYSNITQFLNKSTFKNVDAVRIPWRIYGDCGQLRVINGDYSLMSRFTTPIEKQTFVSKAIVRGGIDDFYLPKTNDSAHIINVKQFKKVVDADGNTVDNKSIIIKCSYDNAVLNHYITKTIEEFVTTKIKRGLAIFANNKIYNSLDGFFSYNEKTNEKLQLANELLGVGNKLYFKRYYDYKNTFYSINGNDFITTESISKLPVMCSHYNVVATINENFNNIFDFTKSIIDIGAYDGGFSLLIDWDGGAHMFEEDKNLTCLLYTNVFLKNRTNSHNIYNERLDNVNNLDSFNLTDEIGLIKIANYDINGINKIIVGALGTIIRHKYPPIIFMVQLDQQENPTFMTLLKQLGYTVVKDFAEKNAYLAVNKNNLK